jgi:hypothetical protein
MSAYVGNLQRCLRRLTLVSELHFHLQCAKFVGDACLGPSAHLLARPLLDAVEFLVDIHDDDLGAVVESLQSSVVGRKYR